MSIYKIAFTFFLLHWAYGIGYARGLWNFILLNQQPKKEEKLSR
jgi:hypothetical protein